VLLVYAHMSTHPEAYYWEGIGRPTQVPVYWSFIDRTFLPGEPAILLVYRDEVDHDHWILWP
jgi:hypothetical protein